MPTNADLTMTKLTSPRLQMFERGLKDCQNRARRNIQKWEAKIEREKRDLAEKQEKVRVTLWLRRWLPHWKA